MRSDNIKKGVAKTPHRSLLMATGVSKLVSAIGVVIPQINIALKIIDAICIACEEMCPDQK